MCLRARLKQNTQAETRLDQTYIHENDTSTFVAFYVKGTGTSDPYAFIFQPRQIMQIKFMNVAKVTSTCIGFETDWNIRVADYFYFPRGEYASETPAAVAVRNTCLSLLVVRPLAA